jgi:hypothetical protein
VVYSVAASCAPSLAVQFCLLQCSSYRLALRRRGRYLVLRSKETMQSEVTSTSPANHLLDLGRAGICTGMNC